jgi:hypothetical protein
MVCLRNISVDTLHKGDTEDNDDDDNNNNNNNNNNLFFMYFVGCGICILLVVVSRFQAVTMAGLVYSKMGA